MRYIRLFVILILAFTCFACNPGSENAERYIFEAESLIDNKPDSALALLDSILYPENLNKEKFNKYNLLRIQARDKSNKDISKDTIIFNVKDYYIKHNDMVNGTLASFYSGRVLKDQKKNKEAMSAYLDAETYADQTINNFNIKGLIQSHIGYLYYNELLQDESLIRFKRAANYFEKAGNYKNEAFSLRDIGNSFLLKKENDSAFYYYQKGLEIADITKDSTCQSSIRHNLGLIFKKEGNFAKSKEYLNKAIPFANSSITRAKIYSSLAQVLYSENKSDSAIFYFEKSLKFLKESNDPFLTSRIYESLSMIEEEKKQL